MKQTANKISTKLSKINVSLSLQQAEKILQGLNAYKKYGDKFEKEIQEYKMKILEIDREIDQGIDEMNRDIKNLDKALQEISEMKKTIGKDIPEALGGIERREKEIQSGINKLEDYSSMWYYIAKEVQGLK